MHPLSLTIEERLAHLERAVRRARTAASAAAVLVATLVVLGFSRSPGASDEIRTHRIVVVDHEGRPRIELAEDETDWRISRTAGLTLMDTTGNERGGFSTMADGSVVLGLDAPRGVGAAMPDRIGLKVYADGSGHVMLIDNQTRAVAKLESDGQSGGVVVYKWDMNAKRIHRRMVTFDGDVRDSVPFGH